MRSRQRIDPPVGQPDTAGVARTALAAWLSAVILLGCATAIPPATDAPDPSSAPLTPVPVPVDEPAGAAVIPPLNPTERHVIGALAELGIAATRAELPAGDASVWSRFDDGTELYVFARTAASDRGDPELVGERQIGGAVVRRVSYPTAGAVRDRFACGDLVVEVEGDAPPRFVTIDAFLAAFLSSLRC